VKEHTRSVTLTKPSGRMASPSLLAPCLRIHERVLETRTSGESLLGCPLSFSESCRGAEGPACLLSGFCLAGFLRFRGGFSEFAEFVEVAGGAGCSMSSSKASAIQRLNGRGQVRGQVRAESECCRLLPKAAVIGVKLGWVLPG
jgi:hypothetical protein